MPRSDLAVIGPLVYCESSALNHPATQLPMSTPPLCAGRSQSMTSLEQSQQVEEDISSDRDFLQELLRVSEDDPTLILHHLEVSPACNSGDNYMSAVTRVRVRGSRKAGTLEGRWSLVLKRQPPKVSTRELLRTDPVFKNETAAYSRVILSFERFSGDGEDAPRVPKCLHANLAFRNDVIVLEDLQPAGFRMCDLAGGVGPRAQQTCATGASEELARYHALSLAMKLLEPEAFLRTRHQIREVIFVQEAAHLFSPSLETACKMAIGGLRISALQAGDDGGPLLLKAVKALEGQRGTIFNKMVGLVKPSEPFSVITHGDFWINNILFRYKEEGGGRPAVEDVRLLDLQVARYCSPAIDILHFLYTSTFWDIRRRHYQELLRAYHQSLTAAFQRLVRGSPHEGEVPMTLRELRREVTRCEMYGLFAGMWIMTAVTADVDNLPDVGSYRLEDFYSDESLANWISTQTPSYRQRTKDLVLEYLDKGIL
uniref:CHK kinase-like domain-containing protein n=1 Tax=Timema cristinae TaxID=61476 RepID=A0A7R9D278_TIMCR|nr:unnamed protein product [Timema cristinae]